MTCALAVAALTACTTTVSGTGGLARSGSPTGDPSGPAPSSEGGASSGGLPSGAPAPTESNYGGSSPVLRSYLYARDATYAATAFTVTGSYSADGRTATVDGGFGFDTSRGVSVGRCLLGVGGATAEVRGVGDDTWANGAAAFWIAWGFDAAAAAKAAGHWVKLSATVSGVAACNNKVFFLGQFEPQDGDDLTTAVATVDGTDAYVITDTTTGVVTAIDRNTGRIVAVHTTGGDLRLAYDATVTVVAPAASEVVTVAGI